MIRFKEWLAKRNESSAFTRRRQAAALGLMPPIPDASIFGHSTDTNSWYALVKKEKKKKKRKKKG